MIEAPAATTNWWVEIGKGLIGAVIGFGSAVVIERYEARESRNVLAASYLVSMASALEGMADSFESGKAPDRGGQTLLFMLEGSGKALGGYIDQDVLRRINDLKNGCQTHYNAVRSGKPMGEQLRVWIGLARMFAGQLRARAEIIKLK